MRVTGAWSRERAERFLERVTVPVRIACRTPGDELWLLSLWFAHDDGALHCATAADAAVVAYLDHDDRVAFEVSTNAPPYRGVRGRGTATVGPDPEKAVLRALIESYLGGTDSRLAASLLSADREEVHIRITPSRLYSWDFTDRMRDALPAPGGDPPPDEDPGAPRDPADAA
jgi:hypothetical protein